MIPDELGRVHCGSVFILTKFDHNYRSQREYTPVFRNLDEAEMRLMSVENRSLKVFTFESAVDFQERHPQCLLLYKFDLLCQYYQRGVPPDLA